MAHTTLVADLHIHSSYSRATSRDLTPEALHQWAQRKGVHLLGSGDCTHPLWRAQLDEKLEPAEDGLWRLRPPLARQADARVPAVCRGPIRFVLQAEISTIYKKAGRTRKVHHLVLLPDRASLGRLVSRLERIGNLAADGRPILGLDSRDLLETVLEASPAALFIPAHVWTPWFSVFGSKSGFDSLEECYGDLTPHVAALETGLSSDPAMNWRWSHLDGLTLVSNSDAHSPSRIGREANRLAIDLSYEALAVALRTGHGFEGTIEFFPEEGKYHMDGHRACGVRWTPEQTRRHGGRCPRCGRPVTVGVMHRVQALADRPMGAPPPGAKPFCRLIPLRELLGEVLGCGPASLRVHRLYERALEQCGPEISILRDLPPEDLSRSGMPALADAVTRMRSGRVLVEPGFDGEYGVIRVFSREELARLEGQGRLLDIPTRGDLGEDCPPQAPSQDDAMGAFDDRPPAETGPDPGTRGPLNPLQAEAVGHREPPLLVLAGPGTGKTFTLIHRMARILREGRADPSQLLAVTFTHRAAREMKDRLAEMLREDPGGARIRVCTLHALGLDLLRSWWTSLGYEGVPFVLDEEARQRQLREAVGRDLPALSARALPGLLEKISRWRQTLGGDGPHDESLVAQAARAYEAALRRLGLLDYDDLLALPLQALEQREDLRAQLRSWLRYLFVDEFQDLNPLQIRLLHRLLPPGAHITAIGDPDQSIYGFRGVDPSHMLDFPGQFPGARVLRLEDNYRSTGTIVEAASAVISHNPSPLPRRLVAIRDTGPPVQCHVFGTERAEALFVAHEINALMGGTSHWAMRRADRGGGDSSPHLSFADMAVLYRFHALAQPVEETLGREGIPCQRYGDRQLRGDPAWDALMAAFRWLVDPGRDSDLARCLCLPSVGLSPEARHRVDQWASGSPCGLWERLSRGESIDGLSDRDAVQLRLQIRSLGNLLGDASGAPVSHTVRRTLQCLRLSVPDPAASGNPVSEAMRRLVSSAGQWQGDLVSWVDHWSLQEEADLYDPRSQRVALLSVHAAKGLEFDVVFVVGCEDGIFPMEARDASLEEERRLFFVAMTRARHRLYLSRARSRRLRGGRREGPASRFLAEIPPHLIWVHEDDPPPPVPQGAEQLRLF